MQTALAPAVQTGRRRKKKAAETGIAPETAPEWTLPNINIPYPEFQTASETQRAEFAARGKARAELEYDTIIQGLMQALGTNELGATQAMAWSKAAYEPIFEQITDWEKEEMERRKVDAASRGLYESGILTTNLNKAAESALKQKTTTGTESARALEDIRKSYELQKGQINKKLVLANAEKGKFAGEFAKVLEDEWTTMMNAYSTNRWSAEFQTASANVTNMLASKNMNLMIDQLDWQKYTDQQQIEIAKAQTAISKIQVEGSLANERERLRLQGTMNYGGGTSGSDAMEEFEKLFEGLNVPTWGSTELEMRRGGVGR